MRIAWLRVLLIVAVATLVALVLSQCRAVKYGAKAELRSNLYNIQRSLERFASDNDGFYPCSIDELKDKGYIKKFPRNPAGNGVEMKQADEGEFSAGDFVYFPMPDHNGKMTKYTLKVYGPDADTGYILELAGSIG